MRDEREARARLLLGLLAADVYKDACAAEMFRSAISLTPDLVAAHVELGMVYCRLEKYGEAVAALEAALKLDETYPDAVALLALTLMLMREGGRVIRAEGLLQKIKPRLARLISDS